MQYNALPNSTLYVKANFKRTPYKNEVVAFRLVADMFSEFSSNKARFLVDLNPDTVTLDEVNAVAETLRMRANALNVVVKMPLPVRNKLSNRA